MKAFALPLLLLLAAPAFGLDSAAAPVPAAAAAAAVPATADTAPALVQVKAKLSNDHPTFGETIQLQVTLTYPSSLRVFFPAKPNLRPFAIDPRNPGTSERKESAATITEIYSIPLIVMRPGLLKTPPIEVPYHAVTAGGGAGESGTVTVAPLKAVVRSQFASETDVKPAPLPQPLPLIEENTPLEVGLFVFAMMLVAAILTFVGLRIYKNRVARAQPKAAVPPHIVAFGRLEDLLRSGRLQEAPPRLVIGELSEILREYLGSRYRFAALDMTSTELLAHLQNVDLRGVLLDEFRAFASESDLVKFAGVPASEEARAQQHHFVRSIVERTMQTAQELDRIRAAEIARLARQRRLRIQVMAPAPLRLRAFAIDAVLGALAVALIAWLGVRTNRQGLFDAAFILGLVWLALRDAVGGASPGKSLVGLQIAAFDSETAASPHTTWQGANADLEGLTETARMAPWLARLQRNLLFLIPGGGLVAEALTAYYLPEQRRLGDQWAATRVIDGRHGLRQGKPTWTAAVLLLIAALALVLLPWLAMGGRPA